MKKHYYYFLYSKLYALMLVGIVVLFFISSCTITKPSAYFKTLQDKDTTIKNFVTDNFESLIVVGDKLSISVSSMSIAEDAFFNSTISDKANVASGGVGGYLVQKDGTILLHRLGNYAVAGLTRKELAKKLQVSLLPYLKEPIVQIIYLNHKLTVIGEVSKPQVINLPEDQISIIDALVLCGDINPNGRKDRITIIRENGDQKQIKQINLENHSIFTSPWYYVKPNDIILVANDNDKFLKQERRNKLQNTLTLVASTVSLALIIITQIFKK